MEDLYASLFGALGVVLLFCALGYAFSVDFRVRVNRLIGNLIVAALAVGLVLFLLATLYNAAASAVGR